MKGVIINRDSWHCRMLRAWYGASEMPKSICPYFWSVVGITLFIIAAGAAALFIGTLFLFASGLAFDHLILGNAKPSAPLWMYLFVYSLPCLLTAVALVKGAIVWVHWADKRSIENYGKPAKPDGVVKSFLKAKKSKICPRISYKG